MPRRRFARLRTRPASLGAKLVLLLTAVGVAGALAITVLLVAIITPSFDQLEATAVRSHIDRTQAALAGQAAAVERAARELGRRYEGAKASGRGSPLILYPRVGAGGMAHVASDARIITARWTDRRGRDRPALRAALVGAIEAADLPRLLRQRRSAWFYARLGDTVATIGVAAVRGPDAGAPSHGFAVVARPIGGAQLTALLRVPARVDVATGEAETITAERRTIGIAVPLLGADGRAAATARFAVPRDVSLLGRRVLLLAIVGSTLLLLIVLVVLRRAIARLVLAPLARVERHMQQVRASGSLSPLAGEERGDEIGALNRSFNAMLGQLRDLREQIEAQSFALGRSESAVAVMHNVRNALTPISTILGQGVAQAPPVDRAMVERAVRELADDATAPDRRARLAAFVAAAFAADDLARRRMAAELEVGREAMAHVLEIIGEQQRRAHERAELEPCDVTDIVARHAAIARYAPGLSIAFSFPAVTHRVLASRVILSQVIGNLFGNAAEAIAATGRGGGSIGVTIGERDGRVVVTIRDDGEGFDAGRTALFFQRGFSTRGHKSGGLGLHWCANSMTAMGGSLDLRSPGSGMGAEAILTLDAVRVPVVLAA